MRKRITLLFVALVMALTMSLGAGAAFADPPGTTGKGSSPGFFEKPAKQQSHTCETGPGNSGKQEANYNPQGKPTSAKCA